MAVFAIKTVISAVDNISKPLAGVNASIKNTLAPIRRLHNATRALTKEMGFSRVIRSIGGMRKAFGGVAGEVRSLGREFALWTGAAAGAVSAVAWRTASLGDAAAKTASRIGISTKAWSELAHVADMNGVSAARMSDSMTRLNKSLFAAASGNKEAQYWFRAAGVSIRDSSGQLRSADDVLGDIANKFADPAFTSGPKRAALAMGIFGRAGAELIPLLAGGRDGIEEQRREAEELGLAFSQLEGQQAEGFIDALTRVRRSLTGFVLTIGKAIIPTLTEWMTTVKNVIVAHRQLIAEKAGKWVEDFRKGLPQLQQRLEKVWARLRDGAARIDGLVKSLGGWRRVLPFILAGLAAFKLAPLILSVIMLGKAVASLGAVLLTTPIGIILALSAGLYVLARNSSLVRTALVGVGAALAAYSISSKFSAALAGVKSLKAVIPALLPLLKLKALALWAGVKACYAFAAAFLATPVGQITAVVAALAALSYYLYDNWDWIGPWFSDAWDAICWGLGQAWDWIAEKAVTVWNGITGFFEGIFGRIQDAFRIGFLEGIQKILLEFNPLYFIANAIDAVFEYFTGISLFEAGSALITGFWDGLKSMWGNVTFWLSGKVAELTDWMPDFIKKRLGLDTLKIQQVPADAENTPPSASAAAGSDALQMVQRRAEREQAMFRASAEVSFRNLPPNAEVSSRGFTDTHVTRAPETGYDGARMWGM